MITPASGRTPRGVRGLKCGAGGPEVRRSKSHPSRGAWIEIFSPIRILLTSIKSHPSRGAWIEMRTGRPSRRRARTVAPLAGCVD